MPRSSRTWAEKLSLLPWTFSAGSALSSLLWHNAMKGFRKPVQTQTLRLGFFLRYILSLKNTERQKVDKIVYL